MRTCVLTLDWGDCMPIVDTVEELLERTYAGGLTKFEPGEMERILVPRLELLEHYAALFQARMP